MSIRIVVCVPPGALGGDGHSDGARDRARPAGRADAEALPHTSILDNGRVCASARQGAYLRREHLTRRSPHSHAAWASRPGRVGMSQTKVRRRSAPPPPSGARWGPAARPEAAAGALPSQAPAFLVHPGPDGPVVHLTGRHGVVPGVQRLQPSALGRQPVDVHERVVRQVPLSLNPKHGTLHDTQATRTSGQNRSPTTTGQLRPGHRLDRISEPYR